MSGYALAALLLCLIAYLACGYFLYRVARVHHVRISFITDHELFPLEYERLPTFDQMLYSWRHQLRWTKAHWIEYVRSL